jgi:hypothetical protein
MMRPCVISRDALYGGQGELAALPALLDIGQAVASHPSASGEADIGRAAETVRSRVKADLTQVA